MIWEKLPATAYLAGTAWLFAILTGVPLGIISSIKRGGITDYLARGFSLFGQALPTFWIAIVAIITIPPKIVSVLGCSFITNQTHRGPNLTLIHI